MRRRTMKVTATAAAAAIGLLVGCGPDDTAEHHQQGSVQGQVTLEGTDDYSGVEVAAEAESATTDEDGEYILNWLPAGEVEITADHQLYVAETKTVNIEPGETTTADFELQLDDQRPAIEAVYTDPEVLLPDDTAEVVVEANNPDEVEVRFDYDATGGFEVEDTDEARADLTTPDQWGAQGELAVEMFEDGDLVDEEIIDLETRTNDDPVIESISVIPEQFEPGETGQLEVEATDPDGDELNYQWDAPEGWTVEPDDQPQAELTAPEQPEVSATIEVTVDDGLGGEASDRVDVSTRDNSPPEIHEVTVEPPQVEPGGEIELSAEASDPDGGDVDYAWYAPGDWTLTDSDQPDTTIIAPDEYENTAEVELEVIDEYGAVATTSVVVSTISAQGPHIEAVNADPTQAYRGEIIELSAVASHPQDAQLDYSWDAPEDWNLIEDDDQPDQPELATPHVPGETATVEVTVTDPQGNEAVGSVVVSTLQNNNPVIESLNAQPSAVLPGETTTVTAVAEDPDGEELIYDWDIPDGWDGSSDDDTLELTAPDDYDQSGTVQLTVDDGWDTTSATVSVSTVTSVDPTISSLIADPTVVQREGTSQLTVEADHAYDEPLSYEWSKDNDDWTLAPNGETAELTAPDIADDQVVVDVVVTDDYGGSANTSVTVQTSQNIPPTISSFEADSYVLEREEATDLNVDAEDPDGGDLSYDWDIDNDDWSIDASDDTAELTAPDIYSSTVVVEVTVEDDYGTSNSTSLVVQTEDNIDPVISSIDADPEVVDREATSQLEVDAFDPNGEPLSYDWSISGTNADEWTLEPNGNTAELTAPNIPDDEVTIEVSVDDGYGGTSTDQRTVESETNNPPEIDSIEMESDDADNEWVERGGTADLFAEASDPDGDDISYDWSISSGWLIAEDDDEATIVAPDDNDVSGTVTLTVTDEWGASDSQDFDVRTQDTKPDDFEFQDTDEEPLEEWIKSDAVEVDGFDGPVEAEIATCETECELSVNGAEYDDDADEVYPGDEIRLRTMSPDETSTTVSTEVAVGDTVSQPWVFETTPWAGERNFTNCQQIGATGPSQTQCDSAYDDTLLEDEVTVDEGIQHWTVPTDGIYRIEVWGAEGGYEFGARMRGDFTLEEGDELKILVGQESPGSLSGGGGTFVTYDDDTPLIIAAGGGADCRGADSSEECIGRTEESGGSRSGVGRAEDGEGGPSGNSSVSSGGGGLLEDGEGGSSAGEAFVNGGEGGVGQQTGGFGGGGARDGGWGAGGGGGYSGGAAHGGDSDTRFGAGGGSYNDGDNQDNDPGVGAGHGEMTIDRIDDLE